MHDKPLLPFISTDLVAVVKSLVGKVVLKTLFSDAKSSASLIRIDLSDEKNLKSKFVVDVGFSAERSLRELGPKVSPLRLADFRITCKKMVVAIRQKLQKKSPLKFPLVNPHTVKFLDPRLMGAKPNQCTRSFKAVLDHLVSVGHISERDCDSLIQNLSHFMAVWRT